MADLAVKRCDRGGVDDHPAFAVGIGLGFGDGRSGQAQHVEAADQVDVDHLGETAQCMRAVLAEDLLATDDTGTVDQTVEAAKGFNGGLHGSFSGGFVADISNHALRAQTLSLCGDSFGIHVHQHHFGAGTDQQFSGGSTQARGAAGDDKNLVLDLHDCIS
ncbi:hypothetical protein D3C81_1713630 [compost metagenome]